MITRVMRQTGSKQDAGFQFGEMGPNYYSGIMLLANLFSLNLSFTTVKVKRGRHHPYIAMFQGRGL